MSDYGARNLMFAITSASRPPITSQEKFPGQMLQGWAVNSAIVIQSGLPWSPSDTRDLSGTGEFEDRWDFFGNPSDFNATCNPIPFYPAGGPMPATCSQAANSTAGAATLAYGCYA